MPVTVDWYDEKYHIILSRFSGNWEGEDIPVGNRMIVELCQHCTERFDIITDLHSTTYTPPVGTLWQWKEGALVRDVDFPNWGLTVIITHSNIIKAFVEDGIQTSDVINRHIRHAKTIEEAISIILSDRERDK